MKTENTPNEFTKQPFEYYENLRDSVLHAATHWKTDRLWSNHLEQINIICLKLQEANKKEILGDRKIVELEHDKTVLKAELKAKDEMLEKMVKLFDIIPAANFITLAKYLTVLDKQNGYSDTGVQDDLLKFADLQNDLLTQYKQGK